MNAQQELKILRSVKSMLNNESHRLTRIGTFRSGTRVVSVILISILILLAAQTGVTGVLLVIGAIVAGVLATMSANMAASLNQWKVINQHINHESVMNRLKELET